MSYILILHILVALSSLCWTGYTFLSPSKSKLSAAYTLVALTIISGTYLIVSKPAHITQTCEEGLVYLAVVGLGIIAAKNKLAKLEIKNF